jgi:ribonuclease HII
MAYSLADLPASPGLDFEQALWEAGVRLVAGIDEAGRGPLAGPVAAAAVILPADPQVAERLEGVRDSKQMSPRARQAARPLILAQAVTWGVGFASVQEIDRLGIQPATRLAASRALEALSVQPAHLLLDCLFLRELEYPQTSLIKGDRRSLSIAAASVLAKTTRDALMLELDQQYPGYGLAAHKGYGTPAHRQAIQRLGACPIHRQSFALLKK